MDKQDKGVSKMKKTLRELGGLSIIHPMWNEEKRFEIQLENWRTWSEDTKDLVDVVIVDDCSNPSVRSYIGPKRQALIEQINLELTIARITDDLLWNTPGALNLGVTVAPRSWVCYMDSDCLFTEENIQKLLDYAPDGKNFVHKFNRWRIDKNKEYTYRPLTCTMMMHKSRFWKVKFDEDFTGANSGGYGFFDNHFDRVGGARKRKVIEGIYATEYMHDIVGRVERDHNEHHRINKKLLYNKLQDRSTKNEKILNFSWKIDYHNERE